MAQYYQLVGQSEQPIQAVTIEELRQYYPNITCVETGNVQYVINQEDASSQFPAQQIVVNSGEATQQVIVDQPQMAFSPGQTFVKQGEGEVVEFQQPVTEIAQSQPQQVFYTTPGGEVVKQQQPVIQQPVQLVNHLIQEPRQIVNHQLIATGQRVVGQHVINEPAGRIIAQPVNNTHVIQQRRVPVVSNQQTTPTRQPVQPEQQFQQQQQIEQTEPDINQFVQTTDGRVMTLAQFKEEHLSIEKKQETPTGRKKNATPKSRASTGRARGGRGRGGAQNNRSQQIQVEQQTNAQVNQITKPFHPNNNPSPKAVLQYTNSNKLSPQQQILQQRMIQPQQQIQTNPRIQPQPIPQQLIQQQPIQQQPVQQQPNQQQPIQPVQPQTLPQSTLPQSTVPQQSIQQPVQQQQLQQPQIQQRVQQPPQKAAVQPHVMQPQPYQQTQQVRRQQPIPLTPPFNGSMQKRSYSPPNQMHQLLDDSSSSLSDEYKDSAKMLVCLENGEQRLITFTLPKESCTVQDLLEQVGVPFNADTKIECVTNTGMCDIDYIVSVGAVSHTASSFIETQQALSGDSLNESQECIVSQSGAVIPVSESNLPGDQTKSPEKPPEPPKEVPKLVPGFLAVCTHCGYLSEDFNRCQRCRTKLPDDPKSIPCTTNVAKQQAEHSKKMEIKSKTSPSPDVKLPAKPGRKGKKVTEVEPVILTLSSDEEDSPSKVSQNMSAQVVNRALDSAVTLAAIQKEPVYPDDLSDLNESDESLLSAAGSHKDLSSLEENALSTTLPCRTIRIGTYKFIPKDEVVITNIGLKIICPLINDPSKQTTIFIPSKYILKVLANFHKSLPVLFFYVLPSAGTLIRHKLSMESGSEIYFDPLSKQDPFKRITLLPDIIQDEIKTAIVDIYSIKYNPYSILEELSTKEANDILIRTCPREPKKDMYLNNEPKQLLIYPPPPAKGGITINVEDYMCLGSDQFLNDAIIDFYLKYLQTEVLPPLMQNKVHMFSSFFYKRLTTKPVKASKKLNPFEIDPNLTPAQKRHCRVKKWTKNVNIFEKDFIIIPINENSHWFLAIVCFPGLDGCRAFNDHTKVIKLPPKEKKKHHIKEDGPTSVVIGNTTITLESKKPIPSSSGLDKPIKCDDEELSDRDEAEGDESELEESESDPESEEIPVKKNGKTREPIKQPCILIFDSLAGAGRSRVVATLRDYLTCEHRAKLNSNKTFSKDNIKGACPKVPQQTNFTDCGLYVLQYVEAFFTKPITDYHIPIKELKDWFKEIVVTRKREEISYLIRDLMTEMKRDVSNIPDLTFPTLNGKLIASPQDGMDEPVTEDEEEYMENELETGEIPNPDFHSSSLVSEMYNSEESDECKHSDEPANSDPASSGSSGVVTMQNNAGTIIVTQMNSALKADTSELPKKSNRETMSYLKSKRILRHKNNDFENNKKQKVSE